MYAPTDVVRNFNVYLALYDAPFRARRLEQLPSLDERDKLPQRFWVIDGRVGPVLAEPIMTDPRVRIIARKYLQGAAFVEMEPVR